MTTRAGENQEKGEQPDLPPAYRASPAVTAEGRRSRSGLKDGPTAPSGNRARDVVIFLLGFLGKLTVSQAGGGRLFYTERPNKRCPCQGGRPRAGAVFCRRRPHAEFECG